MNGGDSSGIRNGVPAGVSVGVGGRGMGDSSYPLAVLGTLGEAGLGVEGLAAGEGEGEEPVGGLLGAGLGVPRGQR